MDINVQQLEGMLHLQEQQAQLQRKNPGLTGTGFDALLAQQLGAGAEQAVFDPAVTANAGLYNQIKLSETESVSEIDPDMAVYQAAFDQASGALDLWDNYARTLGASTSNTALRDAYAMLEGIDGQVSLLKASPAAGKSAALDAIINELEVLSATEKFKFNRGDYQI